MNIKFILIGLTVFLTALWGGSYLLAGTEQLWYNFALFTTVALTGLAGMSLTIMGFVGLSK